MTLKAADIRLGMVIAVGTVDFVLADLAGHPPAPSSRWCGTACRDADGGPGAIA